MIPAGAADRTLRYSLTECRDFCHSLVFLLENGMRLEAALAMMSGTESGSRRGILLSALRESLRRGGGMVSVLGGLIRKPDPVFLTLLRAGEISGDLKKSLAGAGAYLDRKLRLRERLKTVSAYPLFLLVLMGLGTLYFSRSVIPSFLELTEELGASMDGGSPDIGANLPDIRGFAWKSAALGVMCPAAGGFALILFLIRDRCRLRFSGYLLRFRQLFLRNFSDGKMFTLFSVMEILAEAGFSPEEAVRLGGKALVPGTLRREMESFLPRLRQGESVDSLFTGSRCFPPLAGQWLRYSRESGHPTTALRGLRRHFEKRLEKNHEFLCRWAEPVLILVSGLILMLLILRLILPLFRLPGAGLL